MLLYPSANRDEAVFDDPFRFDSARTPNEHVAFGFGTHFCLGASLARLEIAVMLDELLARLPDLASPTPTPTSSTGPPTSSAASRCSPSGSDRRGRTRSLPDMSTSRPRCQRPPASTPRPPSSARRTSRAGWTTLLPPGRASCGPAA